ncbi:hypothetical protein [Mesorhizobium sp. M0643]|uniref:hypothetical protein n=1 Tax=Mesorhizobium sp. M0643 TaxID=2956978 RepID=UPI003339624A
METGRLAVERRQGTERVKIDTGAAPTRQGAGRPIEHPGRKLQPAIGRQPETVQRNTSPPPFSILDLLMNVNDAAGPWMPRIENLTFFGTVGILSSCCSTLRRGAIGYWVLYLSVHENTFRWKLWGHSAI